MSVACVLSGPYQRILLMKDKLTMNSMEKIVDVFLIDEWSSIARLYNSVVQFAAVYKGQTFTADWCLIDVLSMLGV